MKGVLYVGLAHSAMDFYMALFPPLLAFFKAYFNLSIVQASLLPAFSSACGSFPQPFMGYFSDRRNRLTLAILALIVTAFAASSIGFAPSAVILACILAVAAVGSSLFHPTAGGLVTSINPTRSNFSLALFLTGGSLGMSIAPIAGTQIVERLGQQFLWIAIFPGLVVILFLLRLDRTEFAPAGGRLAGRVNLALLRTPGLRPLWVLYAIAVLRSTVGFSFYSFSSLLLTARGESNASIGWIISAYLLTSTVGRIVGGCVGDHVTPRKLLAFSVVSSTPFLVAFTLFEEPSAFLFLISAGFFGELCASTNIILAQRTLPQNVSTATGVVMGLSWGTSGLMLPLVGMLAEMTSISVALSYVSLLHLFAALLVMALPASAQDEVEQARV